MKILIADDDALSRAILRDMLSDWPGEVVFAADGVQAWEALQDPNPPRIAVLDWVMPGADGVELASRLLVRGDNPFTYVVLLTGRDGDDDVVRALDAGAHDFLSKPFSPAVLAARLAVGRRLVMADDSVKSYAARMEALASIDALTGAANRRHFLEQSRRELRRAARNGDSTSVLLFDLDHFKRINDTFGHEQGDRVLRAVVDGLKGALRAADLVGRLGGEEFAVLLPQTGGAGAVEAAERVRAAVASVRVPAGGNFPWVSASVGVAGVAAGELDVGRALQRADRAMYVAKDGGRDRVVAAQTPSVTQTPTPFPTPPSF